MRLGVIARADRGGLATMTVEMVRALRPASVLLVDLGVNGRGPTDPTRIEPYCERLWTADAHGANTYHFPTSADLFFDSCRGGCIYCVDTDTEILTRHGWRRYDEVATSDEALTLTAEHLSEWQPITAIYMFPAGRRRMLSIESRGHSSLSTEDHRWFVEHQFTGYRPHHNRKEKQIRTSRRLRNADKIPRGAPCINLPTETKYTDSLVELVAWFFTEGHILKSGAGRPTRSVEICQSHLRNEANCIRIRAAMTATFGSASMSLLGPDHRPLAEPAWREDRYQERNTVWRMNGAAGDVLTAHAPNKVVTLDFVQSLTRAQLELFVTVSMLADNNGPRAFAQKDPRRLDAFEMACILLGKGVARRADRAAGTMTSVSIYKNAYMHLCEADRRWIDYKGPVWCPTTPNGSWLARRNGTVFYTGNTAETLYDRRCAELCRANDCRLVLHVMPELLHLPGVRAADAVWLPTRWRAAEVAAARTGRAAAEIVPVPVAADRFEGRWRPRDRAEVFFAHGGEAFHDRNGLDLVYAACWNIDRPCLLLVRGGPAPAETRWTAGKVTVEWLPPVDDYIDAIPPEADILLMPRRYGGLSLPLVEAAVQGLAVVTSNLVPQIDWVAEDLRVPMTHSTLVEMKGGRIDVYDTDPRYLADIWNGLLASPARVARASTEMRAWGLSLAWDRWTSEYEARFATLAA